MCNYIKNLYILLPEKIANIKSKYTLWLYTTHSQQQKIKNTKKKRKKHGGKKKEIKK